MFTTQTTQILDDQFIHLMVTIGRRPIINPELRLTFTQTDYYYLRAWGVNPLSTVQELKDREAAR